MTADSDSSTLRLIWTISAPIISFILFLILGVFELDVTTKLLIGCSFIISWAFLMLIGFALDWLKRNRKRMKYLTQSDAVVNLWLAIVDMSEDGSAVVTRKISGVNRAIKRSFYEFESQVDLPREPDYEEEARRARTMDITVHLRRKDGTVQTPFRDAHYEPKSVRKVDAASHIIPLDNPSNGIPPLEPDEYFEIEIREHVKPGSFVMTGDFYSHRIRHLTEAFKVELILPSGWRFPERLRPEEKRAVGWVKSPTLGQWMETAIQPIVEEFEDRQRVVWEVKPQTFLFPYTEIDLSKLDPKLLHTYKVTYSRLERAPASE